MPCAPWGRASWPGLAFVLCACVSSTQAAEPAAVEWGVAASLRQRTLSEWSDAGGRLVTEEGALASIRLDASLPRQALALQATITQGNLDYEGQTQAGQRVATATRHAERELALLWRPLEPASWGQMALGLGWLRAERSIASSAAAGGLKETSTLLMPSVEWRGPAWAWPGAKVQLEALWRLSARHRLAVDYLGAFDGSSLRGSGRHEIALRLRLFAAQEWLWSAEASHVRQAASVAMPLYRHGSPVGTVRLPRIRIDDLSLSLTRRF